MSEVKVNKVSPRSGTTVTIGDSGDTINIVGTLQNNGSPLTGDISSVVAGTGLSGGATSGVATLNIEAAQPTITSLGTITGFTSTGIDDNATSTAITIDSSQNVDVVGTTTSSNFISDGTGYGIKFPLNGTATLNTSANSVIFTGSGSTGDYLAGTLNLQSRGTLDRDINLITGATPSNTLTAHGNGDVSFYEDTGTTAKLFWDASAERLGIGTSSPTLPLEVSGSALIGGSIVATGSTTTTNSRRAIMTHDGSSMIFKASGDSTNRNIVFERSGDGSSDEVMRITTGKTVGINRTSTHGILDVGANAGGSGITTISASTGINQANEYHDIMMVNNGGSYGAGLRRTLTQNTPAYLNPRLDFVVQNNNTSDVADRGVKMTILGNGRVGIGTTSPTNALTVGGDINSNKLQLSSNAGSATRLLLITDTGNAGPNRNFIEFHNNSGSTAGRIEHNSSTTVSYITSSDYRLKENVSYDFDATTRLKQLKPARFNFIADADKTVDGFLAHEVSDIVPEAISGEKDELQVWKEGEELPEGVSVGDNKLDDDGNTIMQIQGIDQSKLVPLLVKTIQELEARITTLENA